MGDNEKPPAPAPEGAGQQVDFTPGLDPHLDARAIVRLIQCSQCSHPLQAPLTLPCGNSLCRKCLPPLHLRENISYPNLASRQEGFTCPFEECRKEHSLADCSSDVTLAKVMDVIAKDIADYRDVTKGTPLALQAYKTRQWEERMLLDLDRPHDEKASEPREPTILDGGRFVATYTLADMGQLPYDFDVIYKPESVLQDDYQQLDVAVLEHLKEATRAELDCHVCYNLMLDPITTTCGHTFCRKCLQRVLDHSNLCPICRRLLQIPPSLALEPSNKRLSAILSGLCPDLLATRAEMVARDETGVSGELDTPLFVCTLSYPSMPTFLHIFEPRYRLMIRRAIESGDRKFGMMMYNQTGAPQGDLGPTQFMHYGTLLHIVSVQMMPDGRSLIETVGVSRFRVRKWDLLDGYTVGNIERIDDVSLAEEERLEIVETSAPPAPPHDTLGALETIPTRQLLNIGISFVAKMKAAAAPWLHERVLAAYGNPPDDPALFPYWFGSILPISDEEKYKLLPTTSVRERLKITARWVRKIEAQRWYVRFIF